jgi:twitching motility protein PilT
MDLETLVRTAIEKGASDLHLEAGLSPAIRVRGELRLAGEPLAPRVLLEIARGLLGHERWSDFVRQRSCDLSRTIAGTRCRINLLHSSRGIGVALRLLSSFQPTIEKLNLHPDFKKLIDYPHGLVLVSGPTGCGKSSTLAALIQEINLRETKHIVTLESPIEYTFRARRAYIRQREVGRDTPSFEQGLLDALREDPDVLMVGEMREPETMRLTLNAAETGHLVLATVHSATCAEALQRVVSAFPAEIQASVAAQLADCLVAVVSQRLRFRPDLNLRVPECEVLVATHAVKNFIRNRDFFKIVSSLETGAEHGMWTFLRYRSWLEHRKQWHVPAPAAESPDTETIERPASEAEPPVPAAPKPGTGRPGATAASGTRPPSSGIIEIEPGETGFGRILKRPGEEE